ncbi:RNA polymerase sigma factor [Larkinella terrae]|uniref:Sigma-70 family RNA polymerase sigma factor n=1 Tax=Larkinella terrae TaxID=2025311 RepID=A0A7K0EKB1_9BACT|nr:sigma-70 family RNA polymerase sigma factor [Larkinella terrae]MRS62162.1 sigma-70 family RNA polymerase sigma factor [Larkinella terrae]
MNDEEVLVRRIVQGDVRAYQTLVERYQRLVLHMVGRIVRQPEDVEDVCQEVFIKVYKHLPDFQFGSKLSTWIASIAYRTAINHGKKMNRELASGFPEHWEGQYDSGLANPEEMLIHQDWKAFLHAQIDKLPVHYRTILTLYHLEELSYEEIGEVTSLPEGTVKNYLFRARKLLKEALQRHKNSEQWR